MIRHIILIVIDCLRADHVSSYGYHRPTTPTMDALASKGLLWERAYSTSSWTRPSVTSLLTGMYPSQHGVFLGIKRSKKRSELTTDILATTTPTLAEVLSNAGWRCGAFLNNAQLGPYTRLDRGFTTYQSAAGKADRLLESHAKWFDSLPGDRTFSYLHFLEAHYPYKPRRRHVEAFGGNRDTNAFRDFSARDYGRLRRDINRAKRDLPQEQLEEMIQMYDGAVRRLDGKVKRILNVVDERGLRDETMVVVTADHGEEFLDHGCIGHGHSLYPELTHVPLIISMPGCVGGGRITEPVSHVDLASTLLSAVDLQSELPGMNLLSFDDAHSLVCSELRIRDRYSQCMRSSEHTLHRTFSFDTQGEGLDPKLTPRDWIASYPFDQESEIFFTAEDPSERGVHTGESNPRKISDTLHRDFDKWLEDLGRNSTRHSNDVEIALDPRVAQRLYDLGYIE